MEVSHTHYTTQGPVRTNNEDCTAFWQPADPESRRESGAVAVLADGVGGEGDGEVASRLACDAVVATFTASPNVAPQQLLFQMFNAANMAVYDQRMKRHNRMATTLTVTVFRNNLVTIGHVGDCRAYLIQNNRIRRVTNDHSYAGVQVKLGLLTVDEASRSELRSVLTRSIGQDAVVRADYHSFEVNRGDKVVHCCDGLYCYVSEAELLDVISKHPPAEACRTLVELAEKRGTDDNLTIQIINVVDVERLSYYRGLPIYQKVPELSMGQDIQPGQLLDERFAITDIISRSGMATIFKANDLQTERVVAVKVPFMQFESDPNFFVRFQREEEIGTRLNHPYLLHIIPVDPDKKSRPYLVMEYLDGQTLGHLMRSMKPLPIADALKISARICEALHYMHTHDVVHRDMKPDNVMICNDGTIRIMDFGIAKVEGQRRLTFGGFQPSMGTPDYMAPEQVKGKRGDPRTDIYSLGAILYEMVTGQAPFEGPNPFTIMNARLTGDSIAPRKVRPEIPESVEEIILRAMARAPGERYSSALEMKAALDNPDAVEITGRAHRLRAPSPLSRWKAHWQLIAIVAVVVIAALALLIYQVARHVHWQ